MQNYKISCERQCCTSLGGSTGKTPWVVPDICGSESTQITVGLVFIQVIVKKDKYKLKKGVLLGILIYD